MPVDAREQPALDVSYLTCHTSEKKWQAEGAIVTNSPSSAPASANGQPSAVVVTGAANGIGAATARHLSANGWQVIGVDIVPATGESPAGAASPIMLEGDVSDPAAWDMVADALASRGLALSGLVNNAAMQLELPLLETTLDQFRRTLDVNVTGMFLGLRLADRLMAAGSAIVNLGSVVGFTADPILGAYCASKGAVLNLTRAAALSFGPRGIRVNAVCPGAVRTPLTTRIWDLAADPSAAQRQMEAAYPRGRISEPEEIASVIAFLLSPASVAMTGSLVIADGGLTATNAEYGVTAGLAAEPA
jgi:NAD(P)-dependent dehydrogenase (short-subunit alcohol dehydrogenase family)